MKYVQFADAAETSIVSVFNAEQDPAIWENLGVVEEDDLRYTKYLLATEPSSETMVTSAKDTLMSFATMRIAPLEDAVEMGDASPEEAASLLAWKKYRIALNRISLQDGYPESVIWPSPPS